MKAVHSRTLVSFLLVIVLAACGTNAGTTSSPAQSHPSSTAKKVTNASISTSLNLNVANINVKTGNLLIQSKDGFQCPYASSDMGVLELGQLVFASGRTTYSQAEIAQMSAYLTYVENHNGNEGVLNGGTEPPPTLHWVLGGETAPIPGEAPGIGCHVTLTLTNTGNTPIQIPKVGVQLKASPQQNMYQYHLIDACSLKVTYCPPSGESGGGACSVFSASIQLGLGKQNDVFSAVPRGDCSTLTIPPAAQVYLDLAFSLAPNIPQNLIYSILPVFTVITTQGEQTLSLPQLGSTLAFASANQFSCYRLQGATFVLVKSPVFIPNPNVMRNWCI
jgi:hypothetical protein